jgi:hypothetical protein
MKRKEAEEEIRKSLDESPLGAVVAVVGHDIDRADERLVEAAKLGKAIEMAGYISDEVAKLRVRCMGQHAAITNELDGIHALLVALTDELRDIEP